MTEEKKTEIRAYQIFELCVLYGITYKTFKKWLRPHEHKVGEMLGKMYTPKQVIIIFECLGEP